MKKGIAVAFVSLMLGMTLAACGGGSSGGTAPQSGKALPSEISAVPASSSGNSKGSRSKANNGLKSKLGALQAASDPGTDYSKAVTTTYVNERTLEQFDIIEQVLGALGQTNYADPDNVNQGPYKVMVAWQDEQNGVQTKTLEPWVVDSSIIVENGREVNRARAWIEESDDEFTQLIKAEFKIYEEATQRSDGSYQDYGVWTLNVKFGDSADAFFAADADVDANGNAVIRIHERMMEGGPGGEPLLREVRAIMNRSDTAGHGKVMFPDWESCTVPNCEPESVVAKYAYDANSLAIQKGSQPPQFKDRNSVTDMAHRYGMYDSVTGQDVLKTKSFGFPVEYTDGQGRRRFAYYGAWQGRHSLWSDGSGVPQGTTVTRQDRGPQQSAESYTVSAPFVGTFTKRIPVAADVDDIKNIPVETWVNSNFELKYRASGPAGAKWYECTHSVDVNGNFQPPVCDTEFTAFDSLIVGANDNRKFVNINRCDNCGPNNPPTNYVFVGPAGPNGAGFFLGTFDSSNGRTTATSTPYVPADNDNLWINIGGSIYIEYTGTGWVEKTLTDFDPQTWTPEFDPNGDKPYELPLDREFYINSRGGNYIVKRTGAGVYDVKIETQSAANPVNASTFVPAGTVFKSQWNPDGESTFTFVTDAASPNFMKLVYNTVGPNEPSPAPTAGQVVQKGQWGLVAYVDGSPTTNQFNWDYPREGDLFGSQQYLMSGNSYVLLSDPILLQPVTLANNAGIDKTFSLQYDGWMHGLPDLFHELSKNGFVMTAAIADKVINIPAGTLVVDALDAAKSYVLKPLEVSQFLEIISDPGNLDLGQADGIDLNSVPDFVEHGMGDMPATTGIKYSEGKLVE